MPAGLTIADIYYKILDEEDLHPRALKDFDRYQITKQVKFKQGNGFAFKDNYFVDDWDEEEKVQRALALQETVKKGGFVIGAYVRCKLVGFASLESQVFGRSSKYVQLSLIHVSKGFRYGGIGRKLFQLCCAKAKEWDAEKLYISSHPSRETQEFYCALGCRPAEEINVRIYEKEPLDLQLECEL